MVAIDLPVEEQDWLLDALRQLVAACGAKTFLDAPLVEPTDRYFPDAYSPGALGARTVTRRLMSYASLGDFRVRLVSFQSGTFSLETKDVDRAGHQPHAEAAGCF